MRSRVLNLIEALSNRCQLFVQQILTRLKRHIALFKQRELFDQIFNTNAGLSHALDKGNPIEILLIIIPITRHITRH